MATTKKTSPQTTKVAPKVAPKATSKNQNAPTPPARSTTRVRSTASRSAASRNTDSDLVHPATLRAEALHDETLRTEKTRAARIRGASSERRERQKQELRQIILKAATELFLEKGYDDFSLRQVAERIGYSATTIYIYFHNKDDLLLETVRDGFAAFDQKMETIAGASGEPLARIEALGRAYIEWGLKNPALYRLMFMQRSDFYLLPHRKDEGEEATSSTPSATASTKKKAGKSLDQPRTVARVLLVAAVQEGIEKGVVRRDDPLVLADILWAGAHGLVSLALSPLMSTTHSQQVIKPLLQSLIEGIRKH